MIDARIINVRHLADPEPMQAGYGYVGRPVPAMFKGSDFGNPFTQHGRGKGLVIVATRKLAVAHFRDWLDGAEDLEHVKPEARARLLARIPWLAERVAAGLNLGCWCAPLACHAEVLLERVDACLATARQGADSA